jgi:hypothetical protein
MSLAFRAGALVDLYSIQLLMIYCLYMLLTVRPTYCTFLTTLFAIIIPFITSI